MSGITAMNTGIIGIQKGLADAKRHADTLASANGLISQDPSSMTEAIVGLKEAETQVKASAEVVKATDGLIGTLIDELA